VITLQFSRFAVTDFDC